MQPDDLAFDSAANLYVAEFADHVVRMVGAKGIIKTFAGTGSSGCSGYGGPAAKAQLTSPLSPVFDSERNPSSLIKAVMSYFGSTGVESSASSQDPRSDTLLTP